jgi:hypothetical protein
VAHQQQDLISPVAGDAMRTSVASNHFFATACRSLPRGLTLEFENSRPGKHILMNVLAKARPAISGTFELFIRAAFNAFFAALNAPFVESHSIARRARISVQK